MCYPAMLSKGKWKNILLNIFLMKQWLGWKKEDLKRTVVGD